MTTQSIGRNTTDEAVNYGKLLPAAVIAAVVALTLNLVVYFIGNALGTLPESVVVPGVNQPITIIPVIFATLMGVIGGTIVFALLGRFVSRPVTIFRIVAITLLIISLAQPFVLPNIPPSMVITLGIMHIITGTVIITTLTTAARR